jgi:CubicO group peptidase (beta-lactamase class C family)
MPAMRIFSVASIVWVLAGSSVVSAQAPVRFEASLRHLGADLSIPGIAYAVVSDGRVVSTGHVSADANTAPLTIDTPLRFASVTKALTAVALMRAVDRGALSLDDSASKWLPEFNAQPEITVRHLAAHVSEGAPGAEYVYATGRYAKLGSILTRALKSTSFEEVLRTEILAPAKMTWRDSPDLGAHAGFVSSVSDMALFAQALQQGRLVTRKRFDEMISPFKSSGGAVLPVGVGFFSQQLGSERVVWSFGQDDPDHSSALLLMVPGRKLALVLLANTDELSNPFRLLMGDVRYSPFATAFLDTFAAEAGKAIGERERLVQAMLVSVWREDGEKATTQMRQLPRFGEPRPDDFAPHFIASLLDDRESADYTSRLDTAVVTAHPANRWALLMSGGINSTLGRNEIATSRFEAILALKNQEADGLARLFHAWSFAGLSRIHMGSDPERALKYVEQGLATGVTGGSRNDLVALQKAATDAIAKATGASADSSSP